MSREPQSTSRVQKHRSGSRTKTADRRQLSPCQLQRNAIARKERPATHHGCEGVEEPSPKTDRLGLGIQVQLPVVELTNEVRVARRTPGAVLHEASEALQLLRRRGSCDCGAVSAAQEAVNDSASRGGARTLERGHRLLVVGVAGLDLNDQIGVVLRSGGHQTMSRLQGQRSSSRCTEDVTHRRRRTSALA